MTRTGIADEMAAGAANQRVPEPLGKSFRLWRGGHGDELRYLEEFALAGDRNTVLSGGSNTREGSVQKKIFQGAARQSSRRREAGAGPRGRDVWASPDSVLRAAVQREFVVRSGRSTTRETGRWVHGAERDAALAPAVSMEEFESPGAPRNRVSSLSGGDGNAARGLKVRLACPPALHALQVGDLEAAEKLVGELSADRNSESRDLPSVQRREELEGWKDAIDQLSFSTALKVQQQHPADRTLATLQLAPPFKGFGLVGLCEK